MYIRYIRYIDEYVYIYIYIQPLHPHLLLETKNNKKSISKTLPCQLRFPSPQKNDFPSRWCRVGNFPNKVPGGRMGKDFEKKRCRFKEALGPPAWRKSSNTPKETKGSLYRKPTQAMKQCTSFRFFREIPPKMTSDMATLKFLMGPLKAGPMEWSLKKPWDCGSHLSLGEKGTGKWLTGGLL